MKTNSAKVISINTAKQSTTRKSPVTQGLVAGR